MSESSETPLQTFIRLLYAAHSASRACDMFDVDSRSIKSVTEWNVLIMDSNKAFNALTEFCAGHSSELMRIFRENGA